MTRKYISIKEAAEYLGVSDHTIRRLIADGELTGYRIGRKIRARIRVDLNEIDEHLMQPSRRPDLLTYRPRQRPQTRRRNPQIQAAVESSGPWLEGAPRKPPKENALDTEFYRYCTCNHAAPCHRWGRNLDERLISPVAVGPCRVCGTGECHEFDENIKRRRRKPAKYRGGG